MPKGYTAVTGDALAIVILGLRQYTRESKRIFFTWLEGIFLI